MSLCPSVCPFLSLCVLMSVCVSVFESVCPTVHLSVRVSVRVSVSVSVCPCVRLCVRLSMCPFSSLSVCKSQYERLQQYCFPNTDAFCPRGLENPLFAAPPPHLPGVLVKQGESEGKKQLSLFLEHVSLMLGVVHTRSCS